MPKESQAVAVNRPSASEPLDGASHLLLPSLPTNSLRARPKLFLPEPLFRTLAGRPGFDDEALDADLLQRILREQLDGRFPGNDADWARLLAAYERRPTTRRSGPYLPSLVRPALIVPNTPAILTPAQWSLPRPPETSLTPPASGTREPELAAQTPEPESVSPTTEPPASSLALPTLSAASAPRAPMAPTRLSLRSARGMPEIGQFVRVLAGVAAASFAVFILPSGTSENRTPAPLAETETVPAVKGVVSAAPVPASPTDAKPTHREPTRAAAREIAPAAAQKAASTRELPRPTLVSAAAKAAIPSVSSVMRDPVPPATSVTQASAPATHVEASLGAPRPASPTQVEAPPPARLEATLAVPQSSNPTTVAPRAVVTPSRQRTAQKRKSIASAPRKRPDVATLVLPDVLKPQ